MRKWLFLLAALESLVACGDQDLIDEPASDLAQVTATADGGVASAPKTGEIGSACTADADCTVTGTTCLKDLSLTFLSISFPGGHCTKACKADADCGTGSACPLVSLQTFLPGISQCLKQCKVASDCREGYRCAASSFGGIPGLGSGTPTGAAAATYCLPPMPGGGAVPPGGAPGGGLPGLPGGTTPKPPR